MFTEQHQTAADLPMGVRVGRAPIPPLTDTYRELDLADAYRIRAPRARKRGGRTVGGRKIGLTSSAMQRQLRVTQPDQPCCANDMVRADRAAVPASAFAAPRVEPEIASVRGRDLTSPGRTVANAVAA